MSSTSILPPYQCPRCGYATREKAHMSNHLYKKKKPCPSVVNKIELTDEIRKDILDNRIYTIPDPKETQNSYNITIYSYQQNNNLIRNVSPIDRVSVYADYKKTNIVDFQDSVDETFQVRVGKLKEDKVSNFQLTMENIIDGVNEISHTNKQHEKCNIYYDHSANTIQLYLNGDWTTYSIDRGIREIVRYMKESFLDVYECYLIRKIQSENTQVYQKSQLRDRLDNYYRFISYYNISPFVMAASDADVMANDTEYTDNDFLICNKFHEQYNHIKTNHCIKDEKAVKQEVKQTLQRNSRVNFESLNKTLLNIIQMDEEFKKTIISKITQIVD